MALPLPTRTVHSRKCKNLKSYAPKPPKKLRNRAPKTSSTCQAPPSPQNLQNPFKSPEELRNVVFRYYEQQQQFVLLYLTQQWYYCQHLLAHAGLGPKMRDDGVHSDNHGTQADQ